MRIAAIYPFLDPRINSIANALMWIGNNGHDVLVITAQSARSLKGDCYSEKESHYPGVTIFRPYRDISQIQKKFQSQYDETLKRIKQFGPNIIYCSGFGNFPLSKKLQKDLRLPIVALTEYLKDPRRVLPFRGTGRLKKIGFGPFLDILSKAYLKYIMNRIQALVFVCYKEIDWAQTLNSPRCPVYYVPWCNEVPQLGKVDKDLETGIHIGALYDFKNAGELVSCIPLMLEKTPVRRFTVIGPGPYARDIRALIKRYPERVEYIPSLPRVEALKKLARAGYGFTPVTDGGLGFIGDCWGIRTPLIASHRMGGFVRNEEDTLVADGPQDLPRVINRLSHEPGLRGKITENAYQRYLRDHTAEAVGKQYLRVFEEALRRWHE